MQTYDYKCEKCDHTFEESFKIVDRRVPTESPCSESGGKLEQIIISATGYKLLLNGSHHIYLALLYLFCYWFCNNFNERNSLIWHFQQKLNM